MFTKSACYSGILIRWAPVALPEGFEARQSCGTAAGTQAAGDATPPGIFKVPNSEKASRVLGQTTNNTARKVERRQLRDQRAYTTRNAAAPRR